MYQRKRLLLCILSFDAWFIIFWMDFPSLYVGYVKYFKNKKKKGEGWQNKKKINYLIKNHNMSELEAEMFVDYYYND